MSRITLGDVTSIFNDFASLTHVKIRGTSQLEMLPVVHYGLKSLSVESSCLPSKFLSGLVRSTLPALTDLDLQLGKFGELPPGASAYNVYDLVCIDK